MSDRIKILVTGGTGRFAQTLKKIKSKYNFIYPSKKKLDITRINSIENYLKKTRHKSVLHLAGFSRPMIEHEKNIIKSINLNIIGTSNLVCVCSKLNIKLIYGNRRIKKHPLVNWCPHTHYINYIHSRF